MSPIEGSPPQLDVELVLQHDGREFLLQPGIREPELCEHIRGLGARTWVFLSLGLRPEKPKKAAAYDKRVKQAREALGDARVLESAMRSMKDPETLEPGLFVLDLPRAQARQAGKTLERKHFYWGSLDSEVECHPVGIFGVDDDDDESMFESAHRGLRDLAQALDEILRDPRALWRQVGSGQVSLLATAAALLGIGAILLLLTTGQGLAFLLFHPVLLPALLLALHLRRYFYTDRLRNPEREFTFDETLRTWSSVRLHLIAVWVIAGLGVALFSAARLVGKAEFEPAEWVDEASTFMVVCVWILTPLAFSSSFAQAFSRIIEGAFAVFMTILFMKLTLAFVSIGTDIIWSILSGLIPFELPAFLENALDATLSICGELIFLAYLLGYTWLKERTHFALMVLGESRT